MVRFLSFHTGLCGTCYNGVGIQKLRSCGHTILVHPGALNQTTNVSIWHNVAADLTRHLQGVTRLLAIVVAWQSRSLDGNALDMPDSSRSNICKYSKMWTVFYDTYGIYWYLPGNSNDIYGIFIATNSCSPHTRWSISGHHISGAPLLLPTCHG